MSNFRKYDHLERLGHRNVQGITYGLVHIFPKLDGTNASVWYDRDDMVVKCGSRRRVITPDDDNAGFAAWVNSDDEKAEKLRWMASAFPELIFYGEWLVPHTIRTYRQETWRRFWIFDVYDRNLGTYVPFESYKVMLEQYRQDFIEPICTIQDPSEEQLIAQCETNTYLISEGAGVGEGVVLKNYAWRQHGLPWAKIVRNVFKEEARRQFGAEKKHGEFQVEVAIAEEFVTPELVGKTRAKVCLDIANRHNISTTIEREERGNGDTVWDVTVSDPNWQRRVEAEHRREVIPQLLGRVYHDLIDEEMWAIVKKYEKSHASINFKTLRGRVTLRVKALAEDLF